MTVTAVWWHLLLIGYVLIPTAVLMTVLLLLYLYDCICVFTYRRKSRRMYIDDDKIPWWERVCRRR